MKYIVTLSILLFVFTACNKDKESQAEKDDKIIQQYLADHNLEATKHSSGLYYNITKEGSGGHPTVGNTVLVNYKGTLTDGTVFDQSASTIELPLSNVIMGWQIGIPLLQPGGKGVFYIPSKLGYGSSSVGSIPANSVLIFEVTLVDYY
jgi:FKBP-type peptidyl-prolyl cis-trans isomerase FkpA